MNNKSLEKEIASLRERAPHADAVAALKQRVFSTVENSALIPSPREFTGFLQFYSRSMLATAGVAFAVVLVLANQIPTYDAYHHSLNSLAESTQIANSLKDTDSPAQTATELLTATRSTREALDKLKLKGVFGVYTQAQCLEAYTLYDDYLDHLADYLDDAIPKTADGTTKSSYIELRSYVADSQQEAARRIDMYPHGK